MSYTYEELHKKTIADLREIAKGLGDEDEAVKGYSQMNKEHLLPALCKALGIEAHAHHEVVGIDKSAVKGKIKALKADRQTAIEARDRSKLKAIRRRIHRLKRKIHASTV